MRALAGSFLFILSLHAAAQPVAEGTRFIIEKRVDEAVNAQNIPFAHAMRAPADSAVAGRTKINAWIRFNLQEAFAQKSKGNMTQALFSLYMARHTLRDSALPFANDAEGNPAPFPGVEKIDHGQVAGRTWRDRIDEDMQAMFDSEFAPGGDFLLMYGMDTAQGPVDRPGQLARPSITARKQPASDPRPDALQIRVAADHYEFSVPVSRLQMMVPKGGLTQKMNPMGGAANNPRYFYFENVSSTGGLVMSGWFESAQRYNGMKALWESQVKEWNRQGLPEPKNVAFDKIDNWEVIFYEGGVGSGRISNSHIRAHWVQAGTWIDMHLSMTTATPDDGSGGTRATLVAFLKSIQVREREGPPTAQPAAGAATTPAPAGARP